MASHRLNNVVLVGPRGNGKTALLNRFKTRCGGCASGQRTLYDSVRTRLAREGEGISYTEFSYMLLQAYDFLELAP